MNIEEDTSDARVGSVWPPTRACLRLRGAKEGFYHPERVNFPLKRAGERGEGKWQRISWEQAFDEIAEGLKGIIGKYGPEAIAATTGTYRTCEEMTSRFCNALGTPNQGGQEKICFGPTVTTGAALFGWPQRHRSTISLRRVLLDH